jgi:anti-anti-sigma factor
MQYTTSRDGSGVTANISGRLTFTDAPQFPVFLDQTMKDSAHCVIDLADLQSIDSTGMSLFIHVYDIARTSGTSVILRNARGQVEEALMRANFDELFTFE